MENHGKIEIANGYVFGWMRMNDGEVCGHVEAPSGAIVKGSYGFWRTNDEKQAAASAERAFVLEKKPDVTFCKVCGRPAPYHIDRDGNVSNGERCNALR